MREFIDEQLCSLSCSAPEFAWAGAALELRFRLVNSGSVPLTGGRVLLIDPTESLRVSKCLVIYDHVDEYPQSAIESAGIEVSLPAASSCEVVVSARVADVVEDAMTLRWQMALEREGALVGSNIISAIARGTPKLEVAATIVEDSGPRLQIEVRNTGGAAAHAVRALARVPQVHEEVLGDVAAGNVSVVSLELDPALAQRTGELTVPNVIVSSADTEPTSIVVPTVAWGSPALLAEMRACGHEGAYAPGEEVAFSLEISNRGDAPAQCVAVDVVQIFELAFIPGSLRRDGMYVDSSSRIELGSIAGRSSSTIEWRARIAVTPASGAAEAVATVSWKDTMLRATARVDIASQALLACSNITADRQAVFPGECARYTVTISNVGTARSARPAFTVHCPVSSVSAMIDGREKSVTNSDGKWRFDDDPIDPAETRELTLTLEPPRAAEGTLLLALVAELEGAERVLFERPLLMQQRGDLRAVVHADRDRLSFGDELAVRVQVQNAGDVAVENVVIARRAGEDSALLLDRDELELGHMAAGESASVAFGARLRGSLAEDQTLPLHFVVFERGDVVERRLSPFFVRSCAAARIEGRVTSTRTSAEDGDIIGLALEIRNTGEGNAHDLVIRSEAQGIAPYSAGTTTVNGCVIGDGPKGALLETDGLAFSRVPPGSHITIVWETRVAATARSSWMNPIVRVRWDAGITTVFAGESIPIRGAARVAIAANDASFALRPAVLQPAPSPSTAQRELGQDGHEAVTASDSSQDTTTETTAVRTAPDVQHAPVALAESTPVIENAAEVGPKTNGNGNGINHQEVELAKIEVAVVTPGGESERADPAVEDTGVDALTDEGADAGAAVDTEKREQEQANAAMDNADAAAAVAPPASVKSHPEAVVVSDASHAGGDTEAAEVARSEPASVAVVRLGAETSADALTKLARYLQGCGGRGLLTHVIALGRLIATVSPDDVAYDDLIVSTKETIHRLFVRSNVRSFQLGADDLETAAMRAAFEHWLEGATQIERLEHPSYGLQVDLAPEVLTSLRGMLESAPIGSRAVYVALAHLIPNAGDASPLVAALRDYREAFIATLSACPDEESFATYVTTAEVDRLNGLLTSVVSSASELGVSLRGAAA